jgi:GxxExxY protein
MELLHGDISDKILKVFFRVYEKLGYGFLEKVYENAMMIELRKEGLHCINQQPIIVYYDEAIIGEYFADIVVEDKIIIELKAVEKINPRHEVQLVNYLKATKIELGFVLNFGSEKAQFVRRIFTNNRK